MIKNHRKFKKLRLQSKKNKETLTGIVALSDLRALDGCSAFRMDNGLHKHGRTLAGQENTAEVQVRNLGLRLG